jgi:hypothetical protein
MKTIIGKVLIILVMAALYLPYWCGEGGSSTAAGTPDKAPKTG